MPTDKTRYHRPQPPADPDQEYMTVQETAYVLQASTNWIRRLLRDNPHLCGRNGNKRIVINREQRAAIHAIRSGGDPRTGRSIPRQRRRPAARTRAAVAA
ncbi:DNA-binding protein [Streptomyces spinosus]|uniref:DNA-binding protein n=1 Tax=Streptomyces spinosus TaxID=2872623 RepID=UPI001CEDC4CD|nr:DNA-binding protein [Streptomyces spinosus]